MILCLGGYVLDPRVTESYLAYRLSLHREQRSVDNETSLAPIEEQLLEESTAEKSISAGNGRGSLFCGCFDLSS